MFRLVLLLAASIAGSAATLNDFPQVGADINGVATDEFLGNSVAANFDGTVIATGGFGNVNVWQLDAPTSQWTVMGEEFKSDSQIEDFFGHAIDLSGDGKRLIIGVPESDNGRGQVLVYEYDDVIKNWTKLVMFEGENNGDLPDRAGTDVSISQDGETIAFGAPYRFGVVATEGEVKVYKQGDDKTSWAQVGATLRSDEEYAADEVPWEIREGGSFFGGAVDLNKDGTRLAVGAMEFPIGRDDWGLMPGGAVRVFNLGNNNQWEQVGDDMLGTELSGRFGSSLDMSHDGKRIVVGAFTTDGPDGATYNAGSAAVFEETNGNWVQIGETFHGKEAMDETGSAVSISGDGLAIAIGHPQSDENDSNTGRVDVYRYDPEFFDPWVAAGAPVMGLVYGDHLGDAVAFSGDGSRFIVGAHGSDGPVNLMKGYARVFATTTTTPATTTVKPL